MIDSLRVVLGVHVSLDASEDERQSALIKATAAAYELQGAFRREVTHDTRVMPLVVPAATEPRTPYRFGDWNLPEMQAMYAVNTDQFPDPVTNWHMWGGFEPNTCGRAPKPGNVGMTYKYCLWETMFHEICHNLGLGHDNKRRLTADGYVTDQYGGESAMASGGSRLKPLRINGPHCHFLGLVEPVEITQSRDVLLCPLRLDEIGRHENEIPLAKIGGMYVYSYDGQVVYCSELLASKACVQYARLDGPGDLVPLLNGLAVEYIESRNATVKVSIVMDANEPVSVDWPETILAEVV